MNHRNRWISLLGVILCACFDFDGPFETGGSGGSGTGATSDGGFAASNGGSGAGPSSGGAGGGGGIPFRIFNPEFPSEVSIALGGVASAVGPHISDCYAPGLPWDCAACGEAGGAQGGAPESCCDCGVTTLPCEDGNEIRIIIVPANMPVGGGVPVAFRPRAADKDWAFQVPYDLSLRTPYDAHLEVNGEDRAQAAFNAVAAKPWIGDISAEPTYYVIYGTGLGRQKATASQLGNNCAPALGHTTDFEVEAGVTVKGINVPADQVQAFSYLQSGEQINVVPPTQPCMGDLIQVISHGVESNSVAYPGPACAAISR